MAPRAVGRRKGPSGPFKSRLTIRKDKRKAKRKEKKEKIATFFDARRKGNQHPKGQFVKLERFSICFRLSWLAERTASVQLTNGNLV